MKKFAFSTDHNTCHANLGIPNDRHNVFFEAAKDVSTRAILFDKTLTDKSQAIEIYMNEINPESDVEFFWAGVVFTDIFSQTEAIAKKISKALNFQE